MALGAARGDVLRMIGEVVALLGVGVATVIPAGVACWKRVTGMLFGVTAADPAMIVLSIAIVAAAALAAGLLPARRASRVEPIITLRYE